MSNAKGRLFVLSAPSGAGKSVVIKELLKMRPELIFSVSATTRQPRPGEVEGISYFFVSRDKFAEMISNNEFFEYAEYIEEFYGTPKGPIIKNRDERKDVLLDIEVQGAKQVFAKEPDTISIFIVPPNMDELERRLRGRGTDTEAKLQARLERARQELDEMDLYDYIIVNDSVTHTAKKILDIIDGKTGEE